MLKKRIIPVLQYIDQSSVKTKNFLEYRNIGNLLQYVRVFNKRESDELCIINLSKKMRGKSFDFQYLKSIISECNMPLSVGGSITNLYEIEELLKIGCDKVIIGESFINNINFLKEIIKFFGSQIVIASIDINFYQGNFFLNYDNKKNYLDYIKTMQDEGAGEIMVTSVHKEGLMQGYDTELIKKICGLINTSLIINGGAGSSEDFNEVLKIDKVQAACASSIFLFSEETPKSIKKKISKDISLRF